jgi:GTP pyrophosphokinase
MPKRQAFPAPIEPNPVKACYGTRLDEALMFVADGFRHKTRKGDGNAPYLVHLLAVTALVGEYGGNEEQMIAALLHDTLEDLEDVSFDDLVLRFGRTVADHVEALSDTTVKPKPAWRTRKERYVASLAMEGPEVKLVSAADKIHNLQSLIKGLRRHGRAIWSGYNAPGDQQVWYYRSVLEALAQGWEHPILEELRGQVATFEAEVAASDRS